MRIESFAANRDAMTDQYDRADFTTSDGLAPEQLTTEFEQIYKGEISLQRGKGKALKHYLENVRVAVNPADIFADMMERSYAAEKVRELQYDEYKIRREDIEAMIREKAFFADCDFGHAMPDWRVVLRCGIPGIAAETELRLTEPGLTEQQRDFYLSVKDAYEGIMAYMRRLQRAALQAGTPNADFAARNLDALQAGAPETLGEAMQLYFIFYSAHQWADGVNVRSLGGLDELLYPFYRHDLDSGAMTEEQIRELLRYFLYKWSTIKMTANIPFYLGAEANELTYLILEEYTALNVYDPKIHIKCGSNTPERLYRMVMDSIRQGRNSFVFVNDELIPEALTGIGQDRQDAQQYTLIGCYEPASIGKEIPCSCNGAICMPVAVETALNNGRKFDSDTPIGPMTGTAEEFDSFEEFLHAVQKQLAHWVEASIIAINEIEQFYPMIMQAPVISATFDNCMERGIDAYAGGAKYNNSSICVFGLGSIVDALVAIKEAVFTQKLVTLPELRDILKNDWKGCFELRKRLRDDYPKWGNDSQEADEFAREITEFMAERINGRPNGRGGVYRMGMFSIDWRMDFGAAMGASAEGRRKGEPTSKNMCASVGLDRNGVTAEISSATKLDYTKVPNGTVLDLSIHPSATVGEDGLSVMVGLLKVFLERGGIALQINVVSAETLRRAQREPERYRNLQVRLCGWNVYFLDLSPQAQDDLIRSVECA